MNYRFMAEETYYTVFSVKAETEKKAREIAGQWVSAPECSAALDDNYDGIEISLIGSCEDSENAFGYDPLITEEDV